MHTIARFIESDPEFEIVVTLPETEQGRWNELCCVHDFRIRHKLVVGGNSREESVRNGLEFCTGDLIGIHDGVRPFVDRDVIRHCFESAEKYGSGVPVISVDQSLRRIIDNTSEVRNRDDFRLVQTPQVFKADIVKKAYSGDVKEGFTDDAGLVQASGFEIHLVDGNRENIKITTPFDLKIANLLVLSA